MILLDDFREEIEAAVKLEIEGAEQCLEALNDAAIYAFDKKLVDMAGDAIAKADVVLPYINLPAPLAWLEFDLGDSEKVGIFTQSKNDNLRVARAVIVRRGNGPVKCTASDAFIDLENGGLQSVLPEETENMIYGCIALLAAPDVIERRRVEVGKLNKKRAQKGKAPLADHEFISLRLQRMDAEDVSAMNHTKPEHAVQGHKRKMHFVRCHLRFYKDKGFSLVRPHWRGNANNGVRQPRHLVTL